jgi:hypothetical protein
MTSVNYEINNLLRFSTTVAYAKVAGLWRSMNSLAKASEFNVGRGGFEPPKAEPTDLQSAPFDRFGISPVIFI